MNPLLLDLPTEFDSPRLKLRCYRPGDGAEYFRALQSNGDHLYEFLPPNLEAVRSAENAEVVIRRLMAEWHLRSLFIFGVWEQATGDYVGETYLANADWHVPCIELGYFVVKDKTGQGFASEAARATLDYAFERLGVIRVELQCAADNKASMGVAERCGFIFEGRMRNRNRKKSGEIVDRLWYGLVREDWRAAA